MPRTCRSLYDYNNGAFSGRGNCYYALFLLHLRCDIFNAHDSNGIVGHGYCEDKSTEHIKPTSFFSASVISDMVVSYQCQLSKWGNDPFPLNIFCWNRYLTSQINHWAVWLADLERSAATSCKKQSSALNRETVACNFWKLQETCCKLVHTGRFVAATQNCCN